MKDWLHQGDGTNLVKLPVRMDEDKAMNTEPAVVFYADDNPRSRRLLTSILQESGFEVLTADDPIEALEISKYIAFDATLVHSQMPEMMGHLAEQIKVLGPDVPVVLLSGRTNVPLVDLAFVDALFGSETTLDDLLDKLKILIQAKLHVIEIQRSRMLWSDLT
jgi:CheY-like chemotaxis protein